MEPFGLCYVGGAIKSSGYDVKILQQYKIQGLLVVDDDSLLRGVLNFNDLLQAGVV